MNRRGAPGADGLFDADTFVDMRFVRPGSTPPADDSTASLVRYLARLDEAGLAALLHRRPDAARPPVPRGFARLAERLCGHDSLVAALVSLDRDALCCVQALALHGGSLQTARLQAILGAPEHLVESAVERLAERALVWSEAGMLRQPDLVTAHWGIASDATSDPVRIARDARVDEARAAVAAFGLRTQGLIKVPLVNAWIAALADADDIAKRVAALPEPALETLFLLGRGADTWSRRSTVEAGRKQLVAAGLAMATAYGPRVPREVLVAAALADADLSLTGPPALPAAKRPFADGLAEADAFLAGFVGLLDEIAIRPAAALKSGGVGTRERLRLATLLAAPPELVNLALDLAAGLGLLARGDAGYTVGGAYATWREDPPALRWSGLAGAWFRLEHAPTARRSDAGKEVPPPVPAPGGAGVLRRTMLGRCLSPQGRRAVPTGAALAWFAPMHPFDPAGHAAVADACRAEARVLGILGAETVTDLGAVLLTHVDDPAALATALAPLLREVVGSVTVQSDLTVLVAGQPDRELAELLGLAAVGEGRGAATVWRLTPAGIRNALDHGWTGAEILAVLADRAGRALPQPVEYLVADVVRRHGHLQVHPAACVVTGEESLIAELVVTRALRPMGLRAVAPTVAVAERAPEEVVKALRAAGCSRWPSARTDRSGSRPRVGRLRSRPPAAKRHDPTRRLPRWHGRCWPIRPARHGAPTSTPPRPRVCPGEAVPSTPRSSSCWRTP